MAFLEIYYRFQDDDGDTAVIAFTADEAIRLGIANTDYTIIESKLAEFKEQFKGLTWNECNKMIKKKLAKDDEDE